MSLVFPRLASPLHLSLMYNEDLPFPIQDVERVDLGPFKYTDVNITGYRMVDPSSPQAAQYLKKWEYVSPDGEGARGKSHPLFSANALMHDAVHILGHALVGGISRYIDALSRF